MLRVLNLPQDAKPVEDLLSRLRLDPVALALGQGHYAQIEAQVRSVMADVATRGDAALVDLARKYDDPAYSLDQLCVTPQQIADGAARVTGDLRTSLRRSIDQVRQYQRAIMPDHTQCLRRDGVTLGLRFTPLDSVGLYVPGGKASYPSSLIMLAVPALVAGVGRVAVVTPAGKYGVGDLLLAVCQDLGITEVYRTGGPAAVGALAFGTMTIPSVDKIVGPGNLYVQLAKRMLFGAVGVDAFLGPSEILVMADDSADPALIAADLLAQAEHDPGSSFLFTTSGEVAARVNEELARQAQTLGRAEAIRKSFEHLSATVVADDMDTLIALAGRFACEHVSIQCRQPTALLARMGSGGAFFLGPWSPVAAGDYVAGPSHCLPTNASARFSSGVSVYEFLKRSSIVEYEQSGIQADIPAISQIAQCEGLDAHARSALARQLDAISTHSATTAAVARADVRSMHGYTPGEQPREGESVIKLNTNENPYPPSPRVMEAVRNLDPERLRKYPQPLSDAFRTAVAEVLRVSTDMVIAGNGSDDIINVAVRTFLSPGEMLVFPDPTYSLYPVLAELSWAHPTRVPWLPDWQLPLDALVSSGAKAVFLANPNAPSGTLVPLAELEALAKRFPGLVLIDEAYVDFAPFTALDLVRRFENVLVTRTFSKGYSLAGLRLGFGVGSPAIIREMMKVKDSYNCDAVSHVAGIEAIRDQEYARTCWQMVISERDRLTRELAARNWSVIPSHANFILAGPPHGDARSIYEALKKRGILVRYFSTPPVDTKVRITIGTPEQNTVLLRELAAIGP